MIVEPNIDKYQHDLITEKDVHDPEKVIKLKLTKKYRFITL